MGCQMTEQRAEQITYQIGLSLGTRSGMSGLSVVEQIGVQESNGPQQVTCNVRHLERFDAGASYPSIIERIKNLCTAEPLSTNRPNLIIDATAVGLAVADMFKRAVVMAEIITVTITGGFEVSEPARHNFLVPKRELVSTIDAMLQSDRLRIARQLTEASVLTGALQGFQLKTKEITAEATSMLWREDGQDDLVFAVALACWYARRPVFFSITHDFDV